MMKRSDKTGTSAARLLAWALAASICVATCALAEDRPEAKGQGEQKLISIVFLLKEPRTLNEAALRKTAAKAYGKQLGTQRSDPDFLTRFKDSMYAVRVDGVQMGIINVNRPYIADPEAAARDIPETRLKRAVQTHKAWLSIDAFGDIKEADREKAYRLIAKFMVGLAGDDVLAIYLPESGKMVWNSPEVLKKLKGEHPLEAFNWDDPVIDVPADDPAMKAAVAKARETFPQFAKAFAHPKAGQHFAAKGYFGSADAGEFMWITVTSIEGNVIHGTLDNLPGRVKGLKVGDRVDIKTPELNDWLIVEADRKTMTGGYTIEVVGKRMKKPAKGE